MLNDSSAISSRVDCFKSFH